MDINDIKTGFRYIDSNGVQVQIVALPGKLKSFQCKTSDRPNQVLRITRNQLVADINSAREIIG